MDVEMPKAGTYVVAVSGGVDSMVLLHLLQEQRKKDPGWKLVVAHLDHGMRPDSAEDRRLVQRIAEKYGLPFVYEEANLGPGASEARAREVRYVFLRRVRQASTAQAIITAHHQDDVIETAIINMLRGTGRKGLTALKSQPGLLRPLANVPKKELLEYAREHRLTWHEDSTNQDETYLRNYVRRQLVPRLSPAERQRLLSLIASQRQANDELDSLLNETLSDSAEGLERSWFNTLSHREAREVMAAWLRLNGVRGFDRKTLERLVVVAKVTRPGKQVDILGNVKLTVGERHLALVGLER